MLKTKDYIMNVYYDVDWSTSMCSIGVEKAG